MLNGEGELIEKVEVPYNGSVAPNDVLVQESNENSWCFDVIGWDKSITNVKEDMTASAIYKYVPTDDFYFKFSLNEDKVSYSLAGLTTGSVPRKDGFTRHVSRTSRHEVEEKRFFFKYDADGFVYTVKLRNDRVGSLPKLLYAQKTLRWKTE